MTDLQPLLNVDIQHIEDSVQVLLRKGKMSLVGDEIFSQ